MKVRKSTFLDCQSIMEMIDQAKTYFKEQGIDQWQNGYPNIEVIKQDIEQENSFVLVKDEVPIATAVLTFEPELSYERVYDGGWLSHQPYGVIHRVAVQNELKGQGISTQMIKALEGICLDQNIRSLRVDTHEDNLSMQRLLKKNGFLTCGFVYLPCGGKRKVFEKLL